MYYEGTMTPSELSEALNLIQTQATNPQSFVVDALVFIKNAEVCANKHGVTVEDYLVRTLAAPDLYKAYKSMKDSEP